MRYTIALLTIGIILLIIPMNISQPSFNGTNPGCDGSGNNPFTLTAPGPGTYRVNAGFKNPNPRRWDSVMVDVGIANVSENPVNPTVFKLYDNYPNPFNPSTIIKYSLPEASFTSIKIYDVVGNQVVVLINEIKSAGTHQVLFNAEGLSSGIYYYTIQSGSFSETKKMVLLK
jgi:hypothetical protein